MVRSIYQILRLQSGRISPESFETVILAGLIQENMDHRIAIVHEYPSALGSTFYVIRFHFMLGEGFFHFLGNGFDLPPGSTAANHKVIGKDGDTCKVEDLDVDRLFSLAGIDAMTC
jgi:hypothetical protein